MHHKQRLKVKSFLCITKKTTEASLIRLHEKVIDNEVICHNQDKGSLPKVRVTQKSKTKWQLTYCARLWVLGCVQGHSQGSRSL